MLRTAAKMAETLRKMKVLIIGASGFIGRNLLLILQKRGHQVYGTFCHNSFPGLIHLDLTNPDTGLLPDCDYLIIQSGWKNPNLCFANPDKSLSVNVYGLQKIINWGLKKGIPIAFASTHYVFANGFHPRLEDETPEPGTVYGQQKLQIEQYLLKNLPQKSLILRYGVVWGKDEGIVYETIDKMQKGQKIHAAGNQIFTPVYVDDACLLTAFLMELSQTGIFHIGGNEHLSRLDLTKRIAEIKNYDSGLITEIDYAKLDFPENRPLNTAINCRKAQNITGYNCPNLTDCITNHLYDSTL